MKKRIKTLSVKQRFPEFHYFYLRTMQRIRYHLVDDLSYIRKKHIAKFGVEPDLTNPRTFNEHQLCVLLSEPSPLMVKCADKYAVREYVEKKIGNHILNELFGVYSSFNDFYLDLPKLPNRFVLKATHGASWNFICKDKSTINVKQLRAMVNNWLRSNFFYAQREKVYKRIPPRIVCERYLEDETGGLTDYKVYCFKGEPKFFHMISGRYSNQVLNTYDTEGNFMPVEFRTGLSNKDIPLNPKLRLGELLDHCKKLSEELEYVRVDFYFVDEKFYIGELTFTSGNGNIYMPREYDLELGMFFDN